MTTGASYVAVMCWVRKRESTALPSRVEGIIVQFESNVPTTTRIRSADIVVIVATYQYLLVKGLGISFRVALSGDTSCIMLS